MKNILFYSLLFLIYSIIGWIIEVIVVGLPIKEFKSRGFMIGPYCPIYGYSSIIIIFYLNDYKDNIIAIFLLTVVICCIIEYLVSIIMEKIFNARWWDYSNKKLNINGRICIKNAICFGLLGVFLIYIANPFFIKMLQKVNTSILNITSIILMTIFIIDLIVSLIVGFNLKKTIEKKQKDSTREFKQKEKELILEKILHSRISKFFLHKNKT